MTLNPKGKRVEPFAVGDPIWVRFVGDEDREAMAVELVWLDAAGLTVAYPETCSGREFWPWAQIQCFYDRTSGEATNGTD